MAALNKKLCNAAESGDVDLVQDCLQKGADVHYKDDDGWTPLHLSAWEGNTDVTNVLLEAGASLSAVDNDGSTPLHQSAWEGNTDVTKVLLGVEASLSAVDHLGSTPLHLSAVWGQTDVINVLLEAGASLSNKNNKGKTPRDVAHDSVKELLQKYAEITDDMVLQFPMMGTAEEMKELISKGTFKGYENRVYLAGACNVGKSTLASILIDDEIPKLWKSTNGLIIYFGRNGIHLKDKTMVPLKKGNGSDGCDVMSKVLRGHPEMKQEKQHSKCGESLPEIEKKCPPPATKEKMTSEKLPAAERKSILIEKTDTELVTETSMEDTHEELPKAPPQTSKMPKQRYTTIHKDIKEQLRKGIYQVNIAPSDIIDFGGQKSFDMTHQLFIQHKGEYILMFNGNIDFCDPLPEYPQGDVTTESILKHWVNSILSYCADDGDILPIILFAATHSDLYTQENGIARKKKLTKDLQELFQSHEQHKRIRFDDIFFINATDENDPEIKRLTTKLVDVAFMQKSWGKEVPMAWVPLDLQLSEMRSNNRTLISKKELTAMNTNNEDLALTDKQIEHFLKNQHSFGKILYFDQHGLDKFIIVQPQSLVNILRSFITDEQFWPHDQSLLDILHAMINTGEILKDHLIQLWSQKEFDQHMPNNDMKEFMIQILVHLDILVEPKSYSQQHMSTVQSYLVPCIVTRELPVTDGYYISVKDKMICLSYKLLKSSIPAALSFKLIGAAMNIWPLKKTQDGVCLYHQAAILWIDETNELHISVKDNKIIIYLINKEAKLFIPQNIASTIQECLTLTLKHVLEFYHKSCGQSLSTSEVSNMFEIEVGEWCETGVCYISAPAEQTMQEWTCKNKQKHTAKFPLFWIFVKTEVTCDESCSGIAIKDLELCPTEKHLARLAYLLPCSTMQDIVLNLGLSNIAWTNIEWQYKEYRRELVNFAALYQWRQQKENKLKYLSDALTKAGLNHHLLCQVFHENVEVFDIDSNVLQQIPDKNTLRDLSKQVGNCAMQLGIELGLSMVEIEETRFRYPADMFSQTFDVLQKWVDNGKTYRTNHILMKAMQASDARGLQFLKEKYA